MINQFCNYEISLKLKAMDFDKECLGLYCPELDIHNVGVNWNTNNINDIKKEWCSAPIWQQVVDWFREKYNIYINIEPVTFDDEPTYIFEIIDLKNGRLLNDIDSSFIDPNEAREQAILKAIELIDQNKMYK